MTSLLGWMAQHFGRRPELSTEQRQRLDVWRDLPQTGLDKPLSASRCVVVDVESSGLDLREDRLISIGAVAVVNGRIALGDSYSVILQQEKASGRENILLHGIGGSAQTEGVQPAEGLLDFLAYLGKDPLVAFHAAFDSTMIKRAIKQHLGFNFKHPWLDLAYVMPGLEPQLGQRLHTLDDWANHFGIQNDDRHNALADALATAQLQLIAVLLANKKNMATYSGLRYLEKMQRWVSSG